MAKRLPAWFEQEVPDPVALGQMKGILKSAGLSTVCEGARCPNQGACWKKGTATFMILGAVCTRECRFCAVESGSPQEVSGVGPCGGAEPVKRRGPGLVLAPLGRGKVWEVKGGGIFAGPGLAIKGFFQAFLAGFLI
ncbi:MAG: lipoyl synthase, partial [Candidatus Omnitrophica bacterium]|nr:lipoyl synthase [Candidatus Omnitrophota bacterium]